MKWFFYPQKLILIIEAEINMLTAMFFFAFSRCPTFFSASYDFGLLCFTACLLAICIFLFAIHLITMIYSHNETFIGALESLVWQLCHSEATVNAGYKTISFDLLFIFIFIQVDPILRLNDIQKCAIFDEKNDCCVDRI